MAISRARKDELMAVYRQQLAESSGVIMADYKALNVPQDAITPPYGPVKRTVRCSLSKTPCLSWLWKKQASLFQMLF